MQRPRAVISNGHIRHVSQDACASHFTNIYHFAHDDRYNHDCSRRAVPGYNGYNEAKEPTSGSSTRPRAQGLHLADALARTHRENREQRQHQTYSIDPECDSLTPSQARGLLMRAHIRALFDGEMISLATR
jgi:hypothetical protein